MKTLLRVSLGGILLVGTSLAAPPEVSNIRVSQRAGTKLIDVLYDVSDPDGGPLTIILQVSSNSGTSYDLPVYTVSGDVGSGVTPGANKQIVWNAGLDWNRRFTDKARARILADDLAATPPLPALAFVPAGFSNPGQTIYTSGFYMDKTEVSKQLWDTVYQWAAQHGYSFSNIGVATAANHPVTGINWYDAVKWCNARSEMEGLTPAYYTDSGQTQVYRTGETVLENNWVLWTGSGYRLPTRAEWRKSYWGKISYSSNFYPWPSPTPGAQQDWIHGGMGNYRGSGDPFESSSTMSGTTPVGYYNGTQTPPGPNMANAYGLYDMFGNVGEWCWDRELSGWFSLEEAKDDNSKGPNTGTGLRRYFSGLYTGAGSYADFGEQYSVPANSAFSYPSSYYGSGNIHPTAIGFRAVRAR